MIRNCVIALLVATAMTGCSSGSRLPVDGATVGQYRLGPGDQIRVIVTGLEPASNVYTVSDGATISLPIIGEVKADGRTTEELELAIKQQIEAGQFGSDASVSVQVERYRPFYILGEVARPGSYPFVPGMSLRTAVALAGGYSGRADVDHAAITRAVGDEVIEAGATPRTSILPGDTIYVGERWF